MLLQAAVVTSITKVHASRQKFYGNSQKRQEYYKYICKW